LIDNAPDHGEEPATALTESNPSAIAPNMPRRGLMKQFWRIFGPDPLTADECVDSLIRARGGIDFDPRTFSEMEQAHLLTILTELINYAARSERLMVDWYTPVVRSAPISPAGSEYLRTAVEGVLDKIAASRSNRSPTRI